MKLKIEYIPIGDIQTYAGNAKLHPAEQIEQIKKSIVEFGMNDPIAVWKDNVIIEGHGRLIACQELGMDTVPVIRLDELTDEQRRAYALVHNKLTMNSGFDVEMLQFELDELSGLNMEDFGFEGLHDAMDTMEIRYNGATADPVSTSPSAQAEDDPYLPEEYDDADIEQYTANQESYTVKRRVIITYLPEQEAEVKAMLGIDGDIKVVYDMDELAR